MFLSTLLFFSFLFAPKPQHIPNSIFDFKVQSLEGETIDFSQFKGKKILIVNTASYCKYTRQYEGLEKLYQQYKGTLVIVGFPANNFFFEEPSSNKKIAAFCSQHYGVTFPMAAKISVKGRNMAPIYHWLTEKKYNGREDSKVSWNFQKYLVDETGVLRSVFSPDTEPDAPAIISAINRSFQ